MGRHTVSVTLRRDGPRTPWGIRLVGGADLSAPLLITRAQPGSPADGRLKRGDMITKIAEYDARDLRHQDAQSLFQNAGNSISVVVQREGPTLPGVGGSALTRSMTQPLPVSPPTPTPSAAPRPPVAGGVATPFAQSSTLPRGQVVFPPPLPSDVQPQDDDINAITHQPYRTTPLVLPGAKVKKDTPVATQSYLRHHPNPHFRAPPAPSATEVLMKQKVADTVIQKVVGEEAGAGKQVVHKQFNSPIGLYSDQNIAETIQKQTGVTPKSIVRAPTLDRRNQVPVSMKKTVKYDPSQSETFKALQEEELGGHLQEVTVPVTPKVFNPTNRPNAVPEKPAWVKVNSLGNYEETIQQSGSFKRLMYQVLGQSDF
ncbi:PDZ and LIM domain protein 3 isoform X2 [Schistocerca serialis cubense]|uniref:PDZ and LIM domain protein 3 isoform X2 n=1 Tax=Schistocerca serialis cubense TaxID=2023355 RepID=UPI00214E154F|nr:PDZ and LIM domain protein 3 isoform X2 [Schistocerca serialis cubense]